MNPIGSLNAAGAHDMRAQLLGRVDLREAGGAKGLDEMGGASAVSGPNSSFSSVLTQFVEGVNDKQVAAGESVRGLISGQDVSLHQAMIAMEEASVSFQLIVEVRNKLLESYQELMRMQV
jgi:flagellar hook-basal body complex protein FliE